MTALDTIKLRNVYHLIQHDHVEPADRMWLRSVLEMWPPVDVEIAYISLIRARVARSRINRGG